MQSPIPWKILFKLARTPDILATALHSLVRRNILVNWDYYLRSDRTSAPFRLISLKITNACNLRCKMCGQWGESGYNFARPSEFLGKIVPKEHYIAMIDQVAHVHPHIYVWGGEPFLYPGLLDVLRHIKSKKLILNIVTNRVK